MSANPRMALAAVWGATAAAIPAAASTGNGGGEMLLSLLAIPAAALLVMRLRSGGICPRCRDSWGWSSSEEVTVEETEGGEWRLLKTTRRSCSSCGAAQLLQERIQ